MEFEQLLPLAESAGVAGIITLLVLVWLKPVRDAVVSRLTNNGVKMGVIKKRKLYKYDNETEKEK